MSERIPDMLAVMTPFPYTIDVGAGISEARAMMVPIVIGSTIKGLFTGLAVGLVARWKQSAPLGMLTGVKVTR